MQCLKFCAKHVGTFNRGMSNADCLSLCLSVMRSVDVQSASSLHLPFRHSAKPLQSNSCRNVDADIDPHKPIVSPTIIEIDPDCFQELCSILHRTVLANTRG
jgi:hypothetical protein